MTKGRNFYAENQVRSCCCRILFRLFIHQSIAGPLTSAEVTKIINRVSVIDPAKGTCPAILRDVIKDDLALQTGAKSRSELLFQDNTLTRIGAETFFSFKTGTTGYDAGERINAFASAEGIGRS